MKVRVKRSVQNLHLKLGIMGMSLTLIGNELVLNNSLVVEGFRVYKD